MTVELLNKLSDSAFILSGVLFLVAVSLFFLLDIPKVAGEVSGKTAKKSIQQIQKHNEGDSERILHTSQNSNVTRPGKSGRMGVGTEKISGKQKAAYANETTLLVDNQAKAPAANETTVLTSNETTLLSGNSYVTEPYKPVSGGVAAKCEVVETLSSYLQDELIE